MIILPTHNRGRTELDGSMRKHMSELLGRFAPAPDRPLGRASQQPLASGGLYPSLVGRLNTIAPGTYPRATRLFDGSILGVHTAFQEGGVNVIAVVRSGDNGVTWTSIGEVSQRLQSIGEYSTRQIGDPRSWRYR